MSPEFCELVYGAAHYPIGPSCQPLPSACEHDRTCACVIASLGFGECAGGSGRGVRIRTD